MVFGHGRCFGAEGHYDSRIAAPSRVGTIDPAGGRQHPLTLQTRILTITEPLRRVLDGPGQRLEALTLLPIAKTPRRADSGLAAGLFKCQRVSLRTYR